MTTEPHPAVSEDVAFLREMWARVPDDARLAPLARTAADQESAGDHPYWEILRWMPAEDYLGRPGAKPAFLVGPSELLQETVLRGLEMGTLRTRFAWGIPTPQDLTWMLRLLDGRGVVEVGAGTGYWAWQLRQAGAEVECFDLHAPGEDNVYCTGGPYTVVDPGGPEVAGLFPRRALLLVWPPRGVDVAARSLHAYQGDLLFLCAPADQDLSGDEDFYRALSARWELLEEAPSHLAWWGLPCRLRAFRRRA
ncbi:hypothetical protein [Streptomyces sp. TR02-1]|uniref:hypothetical protein n=1 Tax=Streptomyces sp. TR02-1 TaxID=3385977 RepID=UPI0039A239B6